MAKVSSFTTTLIGGVLILVAFSSFLGAAGELLQNSVHHSSSKAATSSFLFALVLVALGWKCFKSSARNQKWETEGIAGIKAKVRDIATQHAKVLVRKSKQLIRTDEYGQLITEAFIEEL